MRTGKNPGRFGTPVLLFFVAAEAHDLLAGVLFRARKPTAALEHSREAVRLAPGDPRFTDHYQKIRAAVPTEGGGR